MKRLLLFILFLPVLTKAQTNWDEYHFATKGYAAMLNDSGGMMDGYKIEKEAPKQFSYGSMTFCRLIDTDVDKVVCGIIIINKPNNKAHYLCLPHPGSAKEIIDQCIRDYQAVFPGYKGGLSDEGLRQLFGLTVAVISRGK